MERKHELLLIIPARNEEKSLPRLLEGLRENELDCIADVLVIDDASEDGTPRIAEGNHIKCITLIYNLGYGSALQMGYKYAAEMGYNYLIQMDADLQHDPCNISKIYACLKRPGEDGNCPDLVLASRFLPGSSLYDVGLPRRLGFAWFRFLVRLLGGGNWADTTTGLQGFSCRAFTEYARFDCFDTEYPDANMILEMALRGFRIVQIPAVMHARTDGKSMHDGVWHPVKYMVRSTMAVFIAWIRGRHSNHQIGAPARERTEE